MIAIRFTKTGVVGIGKNELREVGRAASAAVGLKWVKSFLPIHFTKRGVRLYGMIPRRGNPGSGRRYKGSYAEAKVKRKEDSKGVKAIGENKPLVWSGRSRSQALQGNTIRTFAPSFRSFRAEITIPANTLNFVKDADVDLKTVTPGENTELEKVFASEWEVQLRKRGRTGRKTVTIK